MKVNKSIFIPVTDNNERAEILKQCRKELGPIGHGWVFSTSTKGMDILLPSLRDAPAILTWIQLKYSGSKINDT